MIDTVKTLCYLSGVSGFEDEVRDYILERAMEYADEISSDPMGNLMLMKKGRVSTRRRIMLCAHMDEVGLIVTSVTDEGKLRFDCVGGIDRRVLIGKKVFVGEDRVPGIIGIKAYHLVDKEEEKNVPKVESMYIDIGCEDRESAEQLVKAGDFVCFDDTVVEFGNGFLKAKALDDRIGCAAMLKLLERELPCDTWFCFTVQEEVGTRGASVASNRIKPDVAIVLEGTTATDIPDIGQDKHICSCGEGIVLPFMDGGTIYDRDMYNTLIKLAEEKGIKWQTKHRISGGTDARTVQRSGEGVKVGAISCAVRSIHTPACVAKLSECEDMLSLAEAYLQHFAETEA